MAKSVRTDLDFGGVARITNLPDAVAAQQPATLAQLNSAVEGLKNKDPVVVRTSSNINLASPGAALDGVTMTAGDRFLAGGQTTQSENGLYVFNGSAVAATRSADANSASELTNAVVDVTAGTSAGTVWRQTATIVTLGTTAAVFVQFGTSVTAATETNAGVAEVATQAETDTGTDDARMVTPLKLKTSPYARKNFSQTFGDGSATQYDITHNLGTLDVLCVVKVVSTGASVILDWKALSTTVVRINTVAAPTSNELRATIIA